MARSWWSWVPVALLMLAAPGGARADELRLGYSADALTMDPGNHRKRETETILRNMYDGLLTRDSEMRLQPELAESWRRVTPLVYEFKLRDGVHFHDGSPLTAADVVATFDRLIDKVPISGETSPRKPLLGPLREVEAVDRLTVRFVLGEPWPQLPAMLPFQEVVSKHFLARYGDWTLATAVDGTGPFRLVQWRPGKVVIMRRFDGYYGGAPGIPPVGPACVDRVVFEIIPNTSSRIAALLAGDVHIIDQVPAYALPVIARTPGVHAVAVEGTRSVFLALNNRAKPFSDRRMRQAAASAIDRDRIIKEVLLGNATRIEGILSPKAFGKNGQLPTTPYDPDAARKLMADAGYADGVDLTLDVAPAQQEVAAAIADDLSAVGLRSRVAVADPAAIRQKWLGDKHPRPGDIWLTSWGNGSLDPVGIFDPTHVSDGRGNSAGYSNPTLDRLLRRAAAEGDRAARARLYRQAEAIVNADLPYVYLWVPRDIYGVSDKVSGWRPGSDGRINLHDACLAAD